MNSDLEEGDRLNLDFTKIRQIAQGGEDVLPVVVQHADTGDVLILAYANPAALAASLRERIAVFWSTSRKELWYKGRSSGDLLDLVEVRVNCEQNSLLYRVRPRTGGVCHTRSASNASRPTCYYRTLLPDSRLGNRFP